MLSCLLTSKRDRGKPKHVFGKAGPRWLEADNYQRQTPEGSSKTCSNDYLVSHTWETWLGLSYDCVGFQLLMLEFPGNLVKLGIQITRLYWIPVVTLFFWGCRFLKVTAQLGTHKTVWLLPD